MGDNDLKDRINKIDNQIAFFKGAFWVATGAFTFALGAITLLMPSATELVVAADDQENRIRGVVEGWRTEIVEQTSESVQRLESKAAELQAGLSNTSFEPPFHVCRLVHQGQPQNSMAIVLPADLPQLCEILKQRILNTGGGDFYIEPYCLGRDFASRNPDNSIQAC